MSMLDPAAEELADSEYARALFMDTFYQTLDHLKDGGPLKALLEAAREDAIVAMSDLVKADPFKPEVIRDLQWRVQRYDAFCSWITTTIQAGEVLQQDMNDEQRAEYEALIRGEEDGKD